MPPLPIRWRQARWLPVAVAAAATVGLLWHASTFLTFLSDDALISLRYAERLAEGKGLTWTDGERVEGYSNLLWVLAVAGLRLVGVDSILAVRLLGVLGMIAAIAALAWTHRPRSDERAWLLPALVGGLALAAAGPMAVWVVGGLEQAAVAGLLAWTLALVLPMAEEGRPGQVLPASIPLALLCLTRPDGALFTAAIAAALLVAWGLSRSSLAGALRLCVLPAAAWLGQLAFRLAYYGDWIPNPARVKVAFTSTRLIDGATYVGWAFFWLSGLTILGLLATEAMVDPRRRRRILAIALPLLAWSVYVSVIGGDIFPGRRHAVPTSILLAFLAAEGLAWAAARSRRWAIRGWCAGAVCLALLVAAQGKDPENERARSERWEWAGEPIGLLLRRAFEERQALMAVDPAGCLPYWSRLPSLDMLGLNDRWIATHPPPDAGTGHLAHEFGDGAYVHSRRPDLVLFCSPWGSDRACFRGGRELLALQGFQRDYRLVTFEGRKAVPGRAPHVVHSRIFVRKESERIGIRRHDDRVILPGWLFAGTPGSLAVWLGEEARLAGRLLATAPGLLPFDLPRGRWALAVDAAGDGVTLEVRRGEEVLARGPAPLVFDAPGGSIEVEIAPAGRAILREVTARRVQPVSAEH
ncbi:MAG TPA: hypothetical protein VN033_02300 [Vulgatibacter sp.]|nr:hypothetical protein [Vulgatibacter sp.]